MQRGTSVPFNPNSIKYQERRKKEIEQATNPKIAMLECVRQYKKKADKRVIPWKLSIEECQALFEQHCLYCDSPPAQISKSMHGSQYLFTGIDRKDNSLGYEIGNVVPCCKFCNFAKHKHSMKEFQAWLDDIAAYYPTLAAKELSKEQP